MAWLIAMGKSSTGGGERPFESWEPVYSVENRTEPKVPRRDVFRMEANRARLVLENQLSRWMTEQGDRHVLGATPDFREPLSPSHPVAMP